MKLKHSSMIGIRWARKRGGLRHGFTLVEMIVSVSIIALLTGLFLANYNSINRRTDVAMSAQVLVTDIRFAQANALGLVKYDGEAPAGGWGVYLSTDAQANNRYIIFADLDDDGQFDDGEAAGNAGGRVVELSPNTVVDDLQLGGVSQTRAQVTFLPPDPITRLSGEEATSTALNIRLKEKINNDTKTISINFLGLVEVID